MQTKRAEEILYKMLATLDSAERARLANDLLREYRRGYPVENLRPLLRSQQENQVSTGVWIASELGTRGKPLLDDVVPLLKHPAKKVRFCALDCVLVWSGPANGRDFASAVALIDDPERAVRWKAMDVLTKATPEQIAAAASYLEARDPQSPQAAKLMWLIRANTPDIAKSLTGPERLDRIFAAVAAARSPIAETKELFTHALSNDDSDVRNFAESVLRRA
jgi:hypothetical protein